MLIGEAVRRTVMLGDHDREKQRAEAELRAGQERLRRSEARFRALIEKSSEAILLRDAAGTILYVSPGYTRLRGFESHEIVGHSVFEIANPDDLPRLRAENAECVSKPGQTVSGPPLRFQHRDGSWRWLEITRTNLLDDPDVQAIVVHSRDITEQVEAVRQAYRHRAELEALFDLSRRLRTARTLEEICQVLVAETTALLQADGCGAAMLVEDGASLKFMHSVGVHAWRSGTTVPASGSMSARVVESRTTYMTDDLNGARLPPTLDPSLSRMWREYGPFILAPLRSGEAIIGTLGVGRIKSPARPPFTGADRRLLEAMAEMGGTAIQRGGLHQDLEQAYVQMVMLLGRTLDVRDAYTNGHSEQMAVWAEQTGLSLGLSAEEARELHSAALLHDIGKIGVPDRILLKPGRLTEEEWAVMREHPVIGERILMPVEHMRGVARLVRHHQERWDGSGYPDGLRGEEIPLGARILAVVDAYSAMIDDRPYRNGRPPAGAIAELKRCAGTQFDPQIVDVFCRIRGEAA